MPRTSSRKRNNRRNDNTVRVTSSLSPTAPEFIPIGNYINLISFISIFI